MDKLLVVTVVVVLAALTAAVVPLLLQLRRTAAALERLADSAARDIRQVAEDVHATRTHVEGLVDRFKAPAPTDVLGGLLDRFGPLISGLGGLLSFFLAPRNPGGSHEQ